MTVDYTHETKSMHILTLRIRISMSGNTRILSSSVEKSKYNKKEKQYYLNTLRTMSHWIFLVV